MVVFAHGLNSSDNGLPLLGRELLFPGHGYLQNFLLLFFICHLLESMPYVRLFEKAMR